MALNLHMAYKHEIMPHKIIKVSTLIPKYTSPVLFFDGAATNGLCAAGGVIFLNQDHYFTLRLNCGNGTNLKAEPAVLSSVLMVGWLLSREAFW